MRIALNGWRRIGVVLATIWCLTVATVAVYELISPEMQSRRGYFVFVSLAPGVYYDDGNVSFADGRKAKIDNRDPATGRVLEPWEIDWAKYSQIPKTLTIRWIRLLSLFLAAPMLTWLAVECAVWVRGWVKRGFKSEIQ
jgi:hypothetical protein